RLVRLPVLADRGMYDVGSVQEGGTFQADVHERCLHARQHTRDSALVDIADQTAAIRPFQEDLLQDPILDEGGADFARTDVHEDLCRHARATPGRRQPIARSISPVSNNGSPMIPEKLPAMR